MNYTTIPSELLTLSAYVDKVSESSSFEVRDFLDVQAYNEFLKQPITRELIEKVFSHIRLLPESSYKDIHSAIYRVERLRLHFYVTGKISGFVTGRYDFASDEFWPNTLHDIAEATKEHPILLNYKEI